MNSTRWQNYNLLMLLGCIVFLFLLMLSVLFYVERTCMSDIAFQAFLITNTEQVQIQVNRFGAAVIHFLPLTAVLLKWPLKTVLVFYSMSFILENILLFILLWRLLKQKGVAFILVLFNVLMVAETFYWTTSEIKQGMSLAIFYFGVMRFMVYQPTSPLKYGFSMMWILLLLTTILFLHPLMLVLLLFISGYLLLDLKNRQVVLQITALITIVAVTLVKYYLLPIPGYDSEKYETLRYIKDYFPNYLTLESFKQLSKYIIFEWYLYIMILSVTVLLLFLKRMWLKLLLVICFSAGYLLLINVTHPNGGDKFYLESFYLMLSVFVLIPFVLDVMPVMPYRNVIAIAVIILVVRLQAIYSTHEPYTKRIEWITDMLQSNAGKFILSEYHAPKKKLIQTWGIPYESILLSSLISPDSARSFIILEDAYSGFPGARDKSDLILGAFNYVYHYYELNSIYYRPATGRYRVLSENEILP